VQCPLHDKVITEMLPAAVIAYVRLTAILGLNQVAKVMRSTAAYQGTNNLVFEPVVGEYCYEFRALWVNRIDIAFSTIKIFWRSDFEQLSLHEANANFIVGRSRWKVLLVSCAALLLAPSLAIVTVIDKSGPYNQYSLPPLVQEQ